MLLYLQLHVTAYERQRCHFTSQGLSKVGRRGDLPLAQSLKNDLIDELTSRNLRTPSGSMAHSSQGSSPVADVSPLSLPSGAARALPLRLGGTRMNYIISRTPGPFLTLHSCKKSHILPLCLLPSIVLQTYFL